MAWIEAYQLEAEATVRDGEVALRRCRIGGRVNDRGGEAFRDLIVVRRRLQSALLKIPIFNI